jgi:outer membrane protein assembly factor BamB
MPEENRVTRHSLLLAGAVATFCLILGGCQPKTVAYRQPNNFVLISNPSFVKVWDVQLPLHPGDSVKGIYFLDGTVHVLTNMNYDHAVNGDSGELPYRNEIGTPDLSLQGSPTLVTGGIVFPTNHTLELYTRTGRYIRSVDVKYNITNQAVGNHNFVYVGLDFHKGCLAQADVTQDIEPVQWTFLTFGSVDGAVGISDNVIYCGSEDGCVRACSEDRTPYWTLLPNDAFDTQSKILSAIAVDSTGCYCSTTAGKLYCLDKTSGKLKWQYFAGVPLTTGPQVTDTAVYQYVPDVGLTAIDKTTKLTLGNGEIAPESPFHSPRWTLKGAARVLAEDDQYVYVVRGTPDEMRGLEAVDKQTGRPAFSTHRRDLIFATSKPKASLIYAVTSTGLVVALKPVVQPGSYGEIAENRAPADSLPSFDGWPAHVR